VGELLWVVDHLISTTRIEMAVGLVQNGSRPNLLKGLFALGCCMV